MLLKENKLKHSPVHLLWVPVFEVFPPTLPQQHNHLREKEKAQLS